MTESTNRKLDIIEEMILILMARNPEISYLSETMKLHKEYEAIK